MHVVRDGACVKCMGVCVCVGDACVKCVHVCGGVCVDMYAVCMARV